MLDTLRGEGVICIRREVDHKRELDQLSSIHITSWYYDILLT